MIRTPDPKALRRAIQETIPDNVAQMGEPNSRFLHIPATHFRALDPDNMLVVGARGTGKSYWWFALQDHWVQNFLPRRFPSGGVQKLDVVAGWGAQQKSNYPGKDVLGSLSDHPARIVWKTVVLYQIAPDFFSGISDWKARVAKVRTEPEAVERQMIAIDVKLASKSTKKLILFDALDTLADDWKDKRSLLKGLFELMLDLRYTKCIRAKAFVRTDMVEDPEIKAFPDASKLLYAKVELTWPKVELYGLLWQHLGNAQSKGSVFRDLQSGSEWKESSGRWEMPEGLRTDEASQEKLFVLLAGDKMGRDRRRGVPYSWIVNHLGDSRAQTTPRSFLAALRRAADNTPEESPLALHWDAIKDGVTYASKIRVDEIREDFPWVADVMRPLTRQKLVVPCELADITRLWKKDGVLSALQLTSGKQSLPRRLDQGFPGILADLEEIGVLQPASKDRINVPDVYRVAFGLGRKGGVKPVR